MLYPIDDEAEVYQTVVDYLERQGVDGLRLPHDPEQINKSAVLRWLLLTYHQEALDNPPPPAGTIARSGSSRQQRRPFSSDPSAKRRS